MSTRKEALSVKNVSEFIRFALSHTNPASRPIGSNIPFPVGDDGLWKYLWGTRGQVCTQALLDARFKSYYSRNGWDRAEFDSVTRGWVENKVHVCDCEGLLDAFLGKDVNADSDYRNYCTDKGPISSIDRPFVIGEAVFNGTDTKKTHVGWVCGFVKDEPLVVESKGLKYGVVISRMSKRAWKYRGLMTKVFEYDPQPEPAPTPAREFVFTRNLKYGCVGDDVVRLKALLIGKGYRDGITIDTNASKRYGGATRRNVKSFQRDNGLTVDGIAGKNTITALGGIYK